MTEPTVPPPEDRQPGSPAARPTVADYVEANIDRYTPDALVAAAAAAGYPEGEVRTAVREASARRSAPRVSRTARRVVYGAYLLTYLVLSAGLLIPPHAVRYDLGWGAWYVLTGVIALAFLASIWSMGRMTSTPALLGIPLAMLAAVGGLCIYTTGTPFGLLS